MTGVEMINMSKRLENFKRYSNEEVYRQAILWQTKKENIITSIRQSALISWTGLHKLMEHVAISPEEYKLSWQILLVIIFQFFWNTCQLVMQFSVHDFDHNVILLTLVSTIFDVSFKESAVSILK